MKQENTYWHAPEFINDLINQLPAAIFWKNTDSVFLGCNQYFAMLADSSPSDIIGKTDYDMPWGKHEAHLYIQDDQNIISTKRPKLNIEEKQTLGDGKTIILLTNKIPLFAGESVVGILGIFHDITERKRIEQALFEEQEKVDQAIIAKTRAEAITLETKAEKEEEMRKTVMVLVGDIVHDLRTPIATMRTIGNVLSGLFPILQDIVEDAQALGSQKVGLLRKKQLNSLRNNDIVNSLKSTVKTMDEFINSTLMELSNAQKAFDSGIACTNLTKCSSRRIIENTLETLSLKDKVALHESTSYDFFLMGNSILIMKILLNLLQNAYAQIQLNKKGSIYISTEKAEGINFIKIKDTAGGASPEVASNLFKEYFTTKKNGTGVGLYFCRRTMHTFGGDITFHNNYGDSIEFILSFPALKNSTDLV